MVAALCVASLGIGAMVLDANDAQAGYLYVSSCSRMGDNGEDVDLTGLVWKATGSGDYALVNRCPEDGSFQIEGTYFAKKGASAKWITTAPPAIQIVHAWTPNDRVLISPKTNSDGYAARFVWSAGTLNITPQSKCCGGMYYGSAINRWFTPSRSFAFQVRCVKASCAPPHGQLLNVNAIQLIGRDNTAPRLSALGTNNLWYQRGRWVRGTWPASFLALDDSGVCSMQAGVDGRRLPGPVDPSPNRHSWTQCPTPQTMDLSVDTARYSQGTLTLRLQASDAASPANQSAPTETLQVDNQPVSVNLSGPGDAPSSAGTQYVAATATAGPSGVAGIACSDDGAPYAWHAGSTARIPVQGVGRHDVVCYAQNRAIDSSGTPASSPPSSFAMTIREPTVFALGFARRSDEVRCRPVAVRVKVPGRWVTIRYHHRRVRVRIRSRVITRTETRCRTRTALRRISVWNDVIEHGRVVRVRQTRLVRVALASRRVILTHRRIHFGAGTRVSGWLGTASGVPLGAQRVLVLSAPDNGLGRFRLTATATTKANGSWSAHLRPGPSRLIEAIYGGGTTTEPSSSAQLRLTVPAKVKLHITPRSTRWTGTTEISGRVLGGYLPSGKLLRLRIGADRVFGTVGIPDVSRDGRFHTSWTFASGRGTVRYWFSVSTLAEADYPYAPASSRRVSVKVGPGP